MEFEISLYVGLAVVLHFVIEYFRRKPQVDNISSKSVLITGCDTGFGNLLAKRLDGLGCRVFVACYTQKRADELRSCSSPRLETVLLDVTKTDSIKKAHQFVVDRLGPNQGLWGLVNNAGILSTVLIPPEYYIKQDLQDVLDVNLLGTMDVSLHFLSMLVKGGRRLVNMASIAGRLSTFLNSEYSVSKWGVEAFSDVIRPYLQKHGVHVAIIEPSLFSTPITAEGSVKARIQRGYDRLPAEDQELLGSDYVDRTMEALVPMTEKAASKDLYWVVDSYQHALFVVSPRKRYSCGLVCRLLHLPLSYMPSCMQDFSQGMVFFVWLKELFPQVPLSRLRQ